MISFLLTILGIIFFTIATIMLVISSFSIRKQQRLDREALSLAERALENFKLTHNSETENFKSLNAQVDKIRKDADQQIKKTENDLLALKKDYQSKIDELTGQSVKDKIVIEETQKQRDDLYQQLNRLKKNSQSQSIIISDIPQKKEQSPDIKIIIKTDKDAQKTTSEESEPLSKSPATMFDKSSISTDSEISQRSEELTETNNTESLDPRSKREDIVAPETNQSSTESLLKNDKADLPQTDANAATDDNIENKKNEKDQPTNEIAKKEILFDDKVESNKTIDSQTTGDKDLEKNEQAKDLPADKDKYLLSLVDDSARPDKKSQPLSQQNEETDEKK